MNQIYLQTTRWRCRGSFCDRSGQDREGRGGSGTHVEAESVRRGAQGGGRGGLCWLWDAAAVIGWHLSWLATSKVNSISLMEGGYGMSNARLLTLHQAQPHALRDARGCRVEHDTEGAGLARAGVLRLIRSIDRAQRHQ